MKIYIADLASYNSGKFAGKWFDLNDYTDAEELKDAISEWREEGGIEYYAVHAYDDCPAQDKFGGAPDFDELYMYHTLYSKYGESFAAWFDLCYSGGCDCDEWEDKYNDENMGGMGIMGRLC